MRIVACERLALESVGGQVAYRPFGWTQVIEGMQEWGEFDAQHPSHDECDGYDDSRDIDSEVRMVEQGVEHDAYALSTADKTEAVERLDKEHACVPWESNS